MVSPGCVVYSVFLVIGLTVGVAALFFAFFENKETKVRTKFFLIAANALTLVLVTLHFHSIRGIFTHKNGSPRKSVSCAPPIHFVIALFIGASLFTTPTESDSRGTGYLVTSLVALLAHLFSVIAYIAAQLDKSTPREQSSFRALARSEAGMTDTQGSRSMTSRMPYPRPASTLEFFQILLGSNSSQGSAHVGLWSIPVASLLMSPPDYTEVVPQEDSKPPNYSDIEKPASEVFSVDMSPPLDPPSNHGSCSPNIPPSPPPAYSLFTAD